MLRDRFGELRVESVIEDEDDEEVAFILLKPNADDRLHQFEEYR